MKDSKLPKVSPTKASILRAQHIQQEEAKKVIKQKLENNCNGWKLQQFKDVGPSINISKSMDRTQTSPKHHASKNVRDKQIRDFLSQIGTETRSLERNHNKSNYNSFQINNQKGL